MKTYYLITILFFLSPLATLAAVDWHDPQAKFRMEIETSSPNMLNFIRLEGHILPQGLKNGAKVFSQNGEVLDFYLYPKTYELFIHFAQEQPKCFLYFGYDKRRSTQKWPKKHGPPPSKERLSIKTVRAWSRSMSAPARKKWLSERRTKMNVKLDKKITHQRKVLGNISSNHKKVESEHNDLKKRTTEKLAKLNSEIKIANATIGKISGENRKLESAVKELTRQSNEISIKIKKRNDKLKLSREKAQNLDGEIKKLKNDISKIDMELKVNERKLKSLDAVIKQLKHLINLKKTTEQTPEAKTKSISDLASAKFAKKQLKIENHEKELRKHEIDRGKLSAKLADIRGKLGNIKKDLDLSNNRKKLVLAEINKSEADIESSRQKLKKLMNDLNKTKSELKISSQSLDKVKKKVATLKFNVQTATKKRAKSELKWKNSLERMRKAERHLANSIRNKDNANKRLSKKDITENEERKTSIEKYFDKPKKVFGKKKIEEVLIKKNPFGSRNGFAAKFKGNLLIKEPGVYEFAINSEHGSHLKIDGALIVHWVDQHPKSLKWEKTGTVNLATGLHDFEYFYQKNTGTTYAAAAWRKKGVGEFKILGENDFIQGWKCSINKLSDSKNHSYPLAKYKNVGHFLIGEDKILWLNCDSKSHEKQTDLIWKHEDGNSVFGNFASLIRRKDDPQFSLASISGKFPEFTLAWPSSAGKRIDPDLSLKIHAPHFIYDDEILEMSVEANSSLPADILAQLEVKCNRRSTIFPKSKHQITLKGRSSSGDGKYQPIACDKHVYPLKGAYLNDLMVTFSLSVSDILFEKRAIKFLPISQCAKLTPDESRLKDENDTMVIPILHRPNLAEKRTWSFSEEISGIFTPTKKVLVISDDFKTNDKMFSQILKECFTKNSIELTFLPWMKKDSHSPLYAELGELAKHIAKTQADFAIVIPSLRDSQNGVPARQQSRLLAAVTQLIGENQKIKRFTLCTPWPSLQENSLEKDLIMAVKRLARDYGTKEFDLNYFIRQQDNWRQAYRLFPESTSVYESHPIQITDLIAEKLAKLAK